MPGGSDTVGRFLRRRELLLLRRGRTRSVSPWPLRPRWSRRGRRTGSVDGPRGFFAGRRHLSRATCRMPPVARRVSSTATCRDCEGASPADSPQPPSGAQTRPGTTHHCLGLDRVGPTARPTVRPPAPWAMCRTPWVTTSPLRRWTQRVASSARRVAVSVRTSPSGLPRRLQWLFDVRLDVADQASG